jgi:VanZ family protein
MIRTKTLLYGSVALLLVITTLQALGWHGPMFYRQFWWFDLAMHFLGGLCASLALGWLGCNRGFTKNKLILVSLVGTFIIGVAWEIGQYILYYPNAYPATDTLSDILMDMFGAVIGIVLSEIARQHVAT